MVPFDYKSQGFEIELVDGCAERKIKELIPNAHSLTGIIFSHVKYGRGQLVDGHDGCFQWVDLDMRGMRCFDFTAFGPGPLLTDTLIVKASGMNPYGRFILGLTWIEIEKGAEGR